MKVKNWHSHMSLGQHIISFVFSSIFQWAGVLLRGIKWLNWKLVNHLRSENLNLKVTRNILFANACYQITPCILVQWILTHARPFSCHSDLLPFSHVVPHCVLPHVVFHSVLHPYNTLPFPSTTSLSICLAVPPCHSLASNTTHVIHHCGYHHSFPYCPGLQAGTAITEAGPVCTGGI